MSSEYLMPFQKLLVEQVDIAIDEVANGKNSHGILLVGPSGTGKTHGLDIVCERIESRTQDNIISQYQPTSPVCRYAAGAKAEVSTTMWGILGQLGKPMGVSRVNAQRLEADLMSALMARRVKLLVFEEFNNAMLSGSSQLRAQIARLLKNIWNMSPANTNQSWAKPEPERGDSRLVILVSGTEDLLKAFEKDKELSSRFTTVIRAQALDFSPPESFIAFRAVFKRMAKSEGLEGRFDPNDDDIASRTLFACTSHLRRLEKLLQRASTLYRRQDQSIESVHSILGKAYEHFGGSAADNPFLWSQAELTNKVRRRLELLSSRKLGHS